jgi:glycosyltransferase involved in cell wall biosynthesis
VPDVVLPVLNESQALPWVLERMPAGYRSIVVDNGSTDGSAELASSLGAQVVHEPVPGFGSACYAGLVAAEAEVVCFMDCDASLDPSELPRVTDAVIDGRADLVLGARIPERGAWPWHARVGNRDGVARGVTPRGRCALHRIDRVERRRQGRIDQQHDR